MNKEDLKLQHELLILRNFIADIHGEFGYKSEEQCKLCKNINKGMMIDCALCPLPNNPKELARDILKVLDKS